MVNLFVPVLFRIVLGDVPLDTRHDVDDVPRFWCYHSSGLFSFASTTFILSLINCQARGVSTPNVVVGMALGVGGLAQFLAGMWEFAAGNTFGATGEHSCAYMMIRCLEATEMPFFSRH